MPDDDETSMTSYSKTAPNQKTSMTKKTSS